jgi:hypothetical protein
MDTSFYISMSSTQIHVYYLNFKINNFDNQFHQSRWIIIEIYLNSDHQLSFFLIINYLIFISEN